MEKSELTKLIAVTAELTATDLSEAAIEVMAIHAKMTRVFYRELIQQGFAAQDALRLTQTWLAASSRTPGGGSNDDE